MSKLLTYREFATHVGATHGSVKRWVHEGMPTDRSWPSVPRIDPSAAKTWLDEHPRRDVAFVREAFVYFVQAGDRIKIGFTSDVSRRVYEIGPKQGFVVELLAVIPGDKRTEAALHKSFERFALGDEWFAAAPELLAFIEPLKVAS